MLEDWRLIKSTQHPPPTAYPPLHQMPPPSPNSQFHVQPPSNFQRLHTPCSTYTNGFHVRSQFEPQYLPHPDQFHFQKNLRRHDIPFSHDNQRHEDVWGTQDHIPKWHTPRAELSKFDGTGVIDWIEDCEFFFDITHTHENSKVQTIIPYLVGEVKECYRYFKLNTYNPY
jgi:hypothetical protein